MNMDEVIFKGIKNIENSLGPLSSAQKILLATDGSVTNILDVLKGHVQIRTLQQEYQHADVNIASALGIAGDDTVNYRVVVIEHKEPLIYGESYIPIERLNDGFKEDIIRADIPIGRILRKHKVESRREIKWVGFEKPDAQLKEVFQTDSMFLSRIYNIIHKDQVLIRLKESFPYTLFTE
jgi:chorismate-pyruvate lyase